MCKEAPNKSNTLSLLKNPCEIQKEKLLIIINKNHKIDNLTGSNFQFSSVAQSCPTLCNPINHSMPGLPVHHQLLEATQTHAHRVGDTILPFSSSIVPFSSHLQSFPESGSFQMSQLFASGGQSVGVSASTSVLPMNTQD